MEFTDDHLRVLFNAWAAGLTGGGVVIEDPGLYPEAHECAEEGWLERRFTDDGELAWFWTATADTALGLGAVLESAQGREN